jgi:hypothetical protein
MMPPTKLPDRHPASDHRWSTASLVIGRSEPTAQRPIAPAKSPHEGHGPRSIPPLTGSPGPEWSRTLRPPNAIASADDFESP